MSVKVALKDFELQDVVFAGKKGLKVQYFDLTQTDKLWTVSSDTQPSDDYVNALNQLKEVLAYSLQLNNGWDFAKEHNRKNEELLKKALTFWKEEIDRCHISGISVVGVGETKGIVIHGSLQNDLGSVKLSSSATIRFSDEIINSIDETIMIGDLAETAFNKIQDEVWFFVFKDKRGGELFSEVKQIEQSGLNNLKIAQ